MQYGNGMVQITKGSSQNLSGACEGQCSVTAATLMRETRGRGCEIGRAPRVSRSGRQGMVSLVLQENDEDGGSNGRRAMPCIKYTRCGSTSLMPKGSPPQHGLQSAPSLGRERQPRLHLMRPLL